MNLLSKKTLLSVLSLMFVFTAKVSIAKTDLDFAIAQKLMLDLRYYCPELSNKSPELSNKSPELNKDSNRKCFKPLTKLTPELKQMISSTGLGGVILFADNLENPEQIKQLTQDLQQAGLAHKYQQPLFISVDQEGGRVVRLPMQYSTSFSGNMAIGATYKKHNSKFATATGAAIGAELKTLGFNINHAPNVDVNVNPNNPVINVRSFSESSEIVAKLGNAQLQAMQAQGIIGTLKHFPGHGDTSVDSHTGLPRVNHDISTIEQVDLKPFQYAIEQGNARMIMTAHIQYPALDASTLVNKHGDTMIKPATMSRTILTDILRTKMQFDGVVITDALDMQGISSFFSEIDAVIHTFQAGADIALMPIKIRSPEDINKLPQLIASVKQAIANNKLSQKEILASYNRIKQLKQSIKSQPNLTVKHATERLAQLKQNHLNDEQTLATASLTAIKGLGKVNGKRVHLVMPDPNKCAAIIQALQKQTSELAISCTDYLSNTYQQAKTLASEADTIVVTSIAPKQSLAEIGGMDDLAASIKLSRQAKWPKAERKKQLRWLMRGAMLDNKQVIFVSLRAPYEAAEFKTLATDVIATYSYTHTTHDDELFTGPVYTALAKLFSGKINASGSLPVTVK